MSSIKKLELLAPAKNLFVGKAAINHGADAVYIGARKQAANSINSIEELINYAHIYHSKVFIALNTILYEHELEKVQKLIHQLHNIGADAIIIQDMGILEMDLPPIPIHASTQANNFELQQVQFLDKIGISRAVLARELSLDEIKRINSTTSIELEAFIHGALCVSLSGQCYMSQAIGQRSANRGECAQACRLKYTLTNKDGDTLAKDKHLLSLKDLSVGEKIAKMANAGIKSFKIEGRLKDEAYVKNVVTYYRQVLDKLIDTEPGFQKDSSGTIYPNFQADVHKSFNRRFTSYFLSGRAEQMVSLHSPKSFGEPLGKVIECQNRKLRISTKVPIANGDGLCFINEKEELEGIRVEKVERNYLLISDKANIEKGTLVYRNHNHAFLKQLENSNKIRKISCSIEVFAIDKDIQIKVTDEDHISVTFKLPEALEKAKKQELIINMFQSSF
jgi:collagenase-like PrtC family protease